MVLSLIVSSLKFVGLLKQLITPCMAPSERSVSGAQRHFMRAGDNSDIGAIQHMLLIELDLHVAESQGRDAL